MFDRLALAVGQWLWRRALIASLLAGLVGLLAYSVDAAGWVAGARWWPGAWLGLLGGAALARARWRGRWALGYAALLLLAGAAEQVGHVLPAPGSADWVLNLHLRSVTLGQRLAGWGSAVAAGRPVGDTGLFVALLALLTWGAAAWLAWAVLRRRQALAGCLPAGLILAANVHLSGEPWQLLVIGLLLALALMIDLTYTNQNLDWEQRGVDYSDDQGLDWFGAGVGLSLCVGALSLAAPLAATPSGWQALAQLFAAPRQQVAATADQLFSGVRPPAGAQPQPVARTPDLTNIGAGIDQSTDTLMWVKLDEPAPQLYPGAPPPPQHYWRSGLFATYTGSGWQALSVAASLSGQGGAPPAPPADRYAVLQQFTILAQHGQDQFAVSEPVSATAGAALQVDAADPATALLAGAASSYSVTSWATRATQAQLRADGTAYPAAIRATYLQLPGSLPGRVAALAGQIVSGAADPYDEALRLQDYLRVTYAYRLDVPPPPAGRDAVDYFLYEAPGGFCSYYASAMAVMLRTLGVPARVATGYAMGAYDPAQGAYQVTGAAAHAWVEVYFPTYGWVEFEPTPARSVFDRPLGAGSAEPTELPVLSAAPPPAPAARGVGVAIGVLVIALVIAGYAAFLVRGQQAPRSPRQQALRLYARVRAGLARAGLSAPAAVTADEFLASRAAALGRHPELFTALSEATALFRDAAYSQHPVAAGRLRRAQGRWRAARLAWIKLWIDRWRTPHERT